MIIRIALINKKRLGQKRLWVRKWIEDRPLNGVYNQLLKEIELEDPKSFSNFLRMDKSAFDDLANMIKPIITRKQTKFRSPISVEERLAITLRFLATGTVYCLGKQI